MASSDAPEFQTIDGTYSPQRLYVGWRDADSKDSRWIRVRYPASYVARVEDIVFSRQYPGYKTPSDFYRDAGVHWLHHRLSELDDPTWTIARDIHLRAFELERIKMEQAGDRSTVAQWQQLLADEPDRKRRHELAEVALEHAADMRSELLADQLASIARAYL